ncbi:MAG: HAD-IA family hydrolase [Thiothrix sp.]|nr:HAD-IA family hydrolase [Thiothrix sp.]HPQ94684.1 HAD-IA family hydrolase [Thiolinea sp.]
MMTASALVLDFGGVISRTLFETHELTEQALSLPAGSLTWRGPFAPATDPLWQAMQRDEISERDYWLTRTREVGQLIGEDWQQMENFVRRARGADPEAVIRPEFLEALSQAQAAGCQLAILSNELDLFYGSDFRSRLPFLQQFALIVDATHTGILKPDPRAYHLITEGLQLPPSACVFVDDQWRNVHGAQALGMQTVHFDVTQPAESYQQALRLLGL